MSQRVLNMMCPEEGEGTTGSYRYNCTPENMRIAQQAFKDDFPEFPDEPFGTQGNGRDNSKLFRGSFAEADLWQAYDLFVVQRLEVERIDAQMAYETRGPYRPNPPFENHPEDTRLRGPYTSNTNPNHDQNTLQCMQQPLYDIYPHSHHDDATLTALRPSYRPQHQDNLAMRQSYQQLTHSDAEHQLQNVHKQLEYIVPAYSVSHNPLVTASQQQLVAQCYQQEQRVNVSTTQQIQHPYMQGYQHSISVHVSNQQQVSTVHVPVPVYQYYGGNGQQIQNIISYLWTDRHSQSYPVPSFTNDVTRHDQQFLLNDEEAGRTLTDSNEWSNLERSTQRSGNFVTLPPVALKINTSESDEPRPNPPRNESYKPGEDRNNLDTVITLRNTAHDPHIPTIRNPGNLHAIRSTRTPQDMIPSFQYYQNYEAPHYVQSKSTHTSSPPPNYPQRSHVYYRPSSVGGIIPIGSGEDDDVLDADLYGDKYLRHCPSRSQYWDPVDDACPVEWEASSPREIQSVGTYGEPLVSSPGGGYPEYHMFKESPLFRFDLPPEDTLPKSSDPYAKSYFSAPELLVNQARKAATDGSEFWQRNARGLSFSEYTPCTFAGASYRPMHNIETTLPPSSPAELHRSNYATQSPDTWDNYVPLRMPPSHNNNQGRSMSSPSTNQERQHVDFGERKTTDWLRVMQKISDVERTTKQILEYDWPFIKNRKNTYKSGVYSRVHNGMNVKKSYSSVVASRKRFQLTTGDDSNQYQEHASSLDYVSVQNEETMQNEQDVRYNKLFLYVRGQMYSVDATNEVMGMFSKISKKSSALKYVVDPNLLKRLAVPAPLIDFGEATLKAENNMNIRAASAPSNAMPTKKSKCGNCSKAFVDTGLSDRSVDPVEESPTDFLNRGDLRSEQVSQNQDGLKDDFFWTLYEPKHLEGPVAEASHANGVTKRDTRNDFEYLPARDMPDGRIEAGAMTTDISAFSGGVECGQGDRRKWRNLEDFEKYEKLLQSLSFT